MRTIFRNKNKLYAIVAIALIFVLGSIYVSSNSSQHAYASIDSSQVSYQSVFIEYSDTLSSIAKKYHNPKVGSLNDYIQKIKDYNHMKYDDIYAGNYIMIPVYHN